jgi:hypothetical protein
VATALASQATTLVIVSSLTLKALIVSSPQLPLPASPFEHSLTESKDCFR